MDRGVTVADLIAFLRTLPPELLVIGPDDESAEPREYVTLHYLASVVKRQS